MFETGSADIVCLGGLIKADLNDKLSLVSTEILTTPARGRAFYCACCTSRGIRSGDVIVC